MPVLGIMMHKTMLTNIICAGLQNFTTYSKQSSMRMTICSKIKAPDKCITHINVANSVINVLKIPMNINFNGIIGRQTIDGWTGVIGQLVRNETDVGIGSFMSTLERFTLLKQSSTLGYSSPIAIMSGKIYENQLKNYFNFINTFNITSWMSIIFSIIFLGLIDQVFHQLHYPTTFKTHSVQRFLSKIFLYFKLSLTENCKYFSNICCVKHMILIGTGILSINFFSLFFTSDILSRLIYDSSYYIDSIDDIMPIANEINLIANKNNLAWQLFQHNPDRRFNELFKKLEHVESVNLREIESGKDIYFEYSHILQYLIRIQNHLDLHIAREAYYGSSFVILYSKYINQNIKEGIDSVINCLFESGLQNFWEFLAFKRNIHKGPSSQFHHKVFPLNFNNIKGLYTTVAVMWLFCIILLIFENVLVVFRY